MVYGCVCVISLSYLTVLLGFSSLGCRHWYQSTAGKNVVRFTYLVGQISILSCKGWELKKQWGVKCSEQATEGFIKQGTLRRQLFLMLSELKWIIEQSHLKNITCCSLWQKCVGCVESFLEINVSAPRQALALEPVRTIAWYLGSHLNSGSLSESGPSSSSFAAGREDFLKPQSLVGCTLFHPLSG